MLKDVIKHNGQINELHTSKILALEFSTRFSGRVCGRDRCRLDRVDGQTH